MPLQRENTDPFPKSIGKVRFYIAPQFLDVVGDIQSFDTNAARYDRVEEQAMTAGCGTQAHSTFFETHARA